MEVSGAVALWVVCLLLHTILCCLSLLALTLRQPWLEEVRGSSEHGMVAWMPFLSCCCFVFFVVVFSPLNSRVRAGFKLFFFSLKEFKKFKKVRPTPKAASLSGFNDCGSAGPHRESASHLPLYNNPDPHNTLWQLCTYVHSCCFLLIYIFYAFFEEGIFVLYLSWFWIFFPPWYSCCGLCPRAHQG